jgi:hypothetical protein
MSTDTQSRGNGSVVENAREAAKAAVKAAEIAALDGMGPFLKRATMAFWIVNLAWALIVVIRWIG